MTTLSGRFRQVEFRIETSGAQPARMPETWLEIEHSGSRVRFKDSAFTTPEEAIAHILAIFPSASEIFFEPLSLRSIFLANARTRRDVRAKSDSGAAK